MWRSLAGVVSRFLRCATERARMSECRRTEAVRMTRTQALQQRNDRSANSSWSMPKRPTGRYQLGFAVFLWHRKRKYAARCVGWFQVTHTDFRISRCLACGWLAGSLGTKHTPVVTSAPTLVRFGLRHLFLVAYSHPPLSICLIQYALPHTLSAEEQWRVGGWLLDVFHSFSDFSLTCLCFLAYDDDDMRVGFMVYDDERFHEKDNDLD
ncbi:hypothetical protein QBC45DRAFT_41921 [Copromyces sp. CBS 386.78]|nr:hypothetical protein QBC45DRAFT_41921 [Copromyces sp. CBS 386.78]